MRRRAPQGARGLKWHAESEDAGRHWSRPARGAWVEIQYEGQDRSYGHRRAPQGARGLKSEGMAAAVQGIPVAPRKGRVG